MKKRTNLTVASMRAGLWYGEGLVLSLLILCSVLLTFNLLWHRNDRNAGGVTDSPQHISAPADHALTIDEIYMALGRYLEQLGEPTYTIKEIIEFEYNFHAIVIDSTTNTGVAELLVDKVGGAVGPEMGPNMMWGSDSMHRDRPMMKQSSMFFAQTALTEAEALGIAANWLAAHLPNAVAAAGATRFDRYYTVHTVHDGTIAGLLSVHAYTGQVWYHTWHGEFVQVLEPAPDEPDSSASPRQMVCPAVGPHRVYFLGC